MSSRILSQNELFSELAAHGFTYTGESGKPMLIYNGKPLQMVFSAGWIQESPMATYPSNVVSEKISLMTKDILREDAKIKILSDANRMKTIMQEMSDYGMLLDDSIGHGTDVFFYQENGKIVFMTDMEYIIDLVADNPRKSIKGILDTLKKESKKTTKR